MAHSILRIDDLLCWSAKIHTKRKKPRHRKMSGVFRLGDAGDSPYSSSQYRMRLASSANSSASAGSVGMVPASR